MICRYENCQREFDALSKDQRYCSTRCKLAQRRLVRQRAKHEPSTRLDAPRHLPERATTPLLMTDEEQIAINLELARKWNVPCAPCRSLSRKEIDELWEAGAITPIEDIKFNRTFTMMVNY